MPERPETILEYGETDGGKSSQLAEIARWEWERSGRISRLISADSGWDPLNSLIISTSNPPPKWEPGYKWTSGGIVQAVNIAGMRDPWNRLDKMARGFWPKVVPAAKAGTFNILMDPPKVEEGKLVTEYGIVGQYFVEGLSTIGKLLLQDHADNAEDRPMWGAGKEGVLVFKSEALVSGAANAVPTSDVIKIGRAVGGHYGSVQKWVLEVLVPRFSEFRSIDRVVWTAHTGKGKDDLTGIEGSVLGPKIVGQASIDETPQKFGHTLHFEVDTSFKQDGSVVREFRAWFVRHPDKALKSLEWPAKISLEVPQAKALLAKYPKGYIPLQAGLDAPSGMAEYLEFLHPAPVATAAK
jgi:hypothetical protein